MWKIPLTIESAEKKYKKILIKVWFQLPPIIYHYKAKNELRFSNEYFYYINPWWVTKFRTKYRIKDMLYLIDDLKTNQRISWNN